jgi:glycosyltransferase involved in cell wall biosynthesis
MAFQGIFRGQMKYLNENGFEIKIICSDGPEVQSVKESEGCSVLTIPFSRKISLKTDIVTIYRLVLILRKIKPHIVHTHTSKAGLIGMISSFLARCPIRIHSVPGLQMMERKGLRRLILNLSERLTYFLSDIVCPNSKSLKEYILNHKMCSSEKIRIIGCGSSSGVNLDKYCMHLKKTSIRNTIRERFCIEDSGVVLAFIGRIAKEKGIHELVESFVNLSKRYANLYLLLIGKYDDIGEYDSINDGIDNDTRNILNNNTRLNITGWVEDVESYLAASDIVVHPSYREGLSNALLQAGSMGLPSVTTNVSGCIDVIKDGETGLIVSPKDSAALEEALEVLILDEDKRMELGLNAYHHVSANFASNIIWEETARFYTDMLKSRLMYAEGRL